jgi:hypothetical protein
MGSFVRARLKSKFLQLQQVLSSGLIRGGIIFFHPYLVHFKEIFEVLADNWVSFMDIVAFSTFLDGGGVRVNPEANPIVNFNHIHFFAAELAYFNFVKVGRQLVGF